MKKIVSVVLLLSMILSLLCFAPSASAVTKLGDLDSDGAITAKDSLILRRYVSGYPYDIPEAAADLNGDGDIDMADCLLMRMHIARVITIDLKPITDKPIAMIKLGGTGIENYRIVIPASADDYTRYAAEMLSQSIEDKIDVALPVVNDTEAATEYEILIGATNRSESVLASSVTLAPNEYLLKMAGTKVVMLGDSYMIGGGVGKFTYDCISYDPSKTGQIVNVTLQTSNTPAAYAAKPAKNAILMIGDGMGLNHAAASLAYSARHAQEPNYTEFSASRLPVFAQMTTASLTTQSSGGTTPTDSAAAGTALACGIKTTNGILGQNKNNVAVPNIRELAVSLGKKNAVMTTELIEGATPSAFLVHTKTRNDIPTITNLEAQVKDCDYMKGDILDDITKETKKAIELISRDNDAGFFIMVEEAKIDTYSHGLDKVNMTHCMARFNEAIRYTMVFAAAHPDTLLIVTADHETGGPDVNMNSFSTNSHTTKNVPVYAIGSGSEKISGTIDNIMIPKIIAAEWGVANFGQ